MGRSKESLKRKRPSKSKDSGHWAKRHNGNRAYGNNVPEREIFSQTATDSLTQSFCDVLTYPQIPYYSWTLYFDSQEYNQDSATVIKIDGMIEFFARHMPQTISLDLENRIDFDIKKCFKDSTLLRKWPEIVQDLNVKPQYTFNCIYVAVFEVMIRRATADDGRSITKAFRILQLNRINIINYEFSANVMPYVKLSSYGKLISIRCRVIGLGLPKFSTASAVYSCKCNRQIIAKRQSETPFAPTKCNVCGNGAFKRQLDSPYQVTKFSQTINVQDCRPVDQMGDCGAISPNIISVNLSSNLFDKFMPGESIKLTGIPRMTLGGSKSSTAGTCPLYVEAISILRDDDDISSIHVNERAIEKIRAEPDVLSLLVSSLCPSVQAHEIIKAALILGLVGGNFANREIQDAVHTLIIGNLGLGKSQLLRACVQAAPKGIYISGSSSTTLEPMMMNVREVGKEDSRLETGCFSSVNRGVCCIDSLDKCCAQHPVLSKFIEEQRINITNSELKFDVEARTSIFSIIDPIKKRYDSSKTVGENVNVNQQLLSKFHMVFLMRDNPNPYCDKLMGDRLLDGHTKPISLDKQTPAFDSKTRSESHPNNDRTLRETLIASPISDILPQKLLRMYIHCARSRLPPEISSESEAVIEQFCLLRYRKNRERTKLERLFRTLLILIQARAKIDFRDETTKQDAFDVVEILEHAVSDDTIDLPLSSSNNSNKLTGNKIKQFLEQLRNEATSLNKNIFTRDELSNIAGKENVTGYSLSTLLSRLNDQGYLLKVSSNSYRVSLY